MADLISGYYGLFKSPLALNPTYGNSMYCVTNDTKSTLVCIILSPDASYDLYNLCKRPTYTNIYLVPISMDILFASPICNTVLNLLSLKPNLKWVYPTRLTTSITEFDNRQLVYSSLVIADLNNTKIEFKLSENVDRTFYDIILYDGVKTRYFLSYATSLKASELYNNSSVDEVHVPYDSTIYGGLNYLNLLAIDTSYRSKFVVHSFSNLIDYENIAANTILKIGNVVYSYLI
jgi:hypothetical protein